MIYPFKLLLKQMIKIFRSKILFRFSTQQDVSDHEIMIQYKQACSQAINKNYKKSNQHFRNSLKIIEKEIGKESENYLHVLKKIVANQNITKDYKEAENNLTEAIQISLKIHKTNPNKLYTNYNNLFIHCIKNNLNKSILIGKALLHPKQKQSLPLNFQKLFLFNLGTAYLLKGNYVDAKQKLKSCLLQEPNDKIKSFALNNLALAAWWHKYPNFQARSQQQAFNKNILRPQEIDLDFQNIQNLLKKSIYYSEGVNKLADSEQKINLEELLQNKISTNAQIQKFSKNIYFKNKQSGTPLINIYEFLMNTNPVKKSEIMFWFKYALRFYEKIDPSNMDRVLITLALFTSGDKDFKNAEKIFLKVLQNLQQSDSYNKILCMNLYGNMLKAIPQRKQQGIKLSQFAREQAKKLVYWSNKIVQVCIPELEL